MPQLSAADAMKARVEIKDLVGERLTMAYASGGMLALVFGEKFAILVPENPDPDFEPLRISMRPRRSRAHRPRQSRSNRRAFFFGLTRPQKHHTKSPHFAGFLLF